jgi:hypothetical protein
MLRLRPGSVLKVLQKENHLQKPPCVVFFTEVESESLFVQISEQAQVSVRETKASPDFQKDFAGAQAEIAAAQK